MPFALKIGNNQYAPQTWYVSSKIMSNWERYYSDNYLSGTILQEILKLSGIVAVKEDAQLSGNQILVVPLTAGVIAPVVGQAVGTIADPMGLMVKQDINLKHGVLFASS